MTYTVSTIKVLLHAKFSKLKSKINWRLSSNQARLTVIKICDLLPPQIFTDPSLIMQDTHTFIAANLCY